MLYIYVKLYIDFPLSPYKMLGFTLPLPKKNFEAPRLDIPEKYITALGANVDCGHGVVQAELDRRALGIDMQVSLHDN